MTKVNDILERIRRKKAEEVEDSFLPQPAPPPVIQTPSINTASLLAKLRARSPAKTAKCEMFCSDDKLAFYMNCTRWNVDTVLKMVQEMSYMLGGAKIPVEFVKDQHETEEEYSTYYVFKFTDPRHSVWFKLNCHDVYMKHHENA